jgi:hypothetical protein
MKKHEAAVRNAEALLRQPRCNVAVLGCPARTWYVDRARVAEITWWLLEENAVVRIGGKLPFDPLVEAAAVEYADSEPLAALLLTCFGPVDTEERLHLDEIDPRILEGADLVVAFPVEGRDVLSADPLVEYALLSRLPVLAVYRDTMRWFTVENYVFG